jgi:glycosyltransferase involved in cell wall biosynthesis
VRVSIAMATYNGGPYLKEQLNSLARQDRMPDELVISDDGSDDDTPALARAFAARAPFPVTVLRNPGERGYQSNFQHALANTSGEVILLADQDDIWQEQHVRHLVEPFEDNPELLVAAADSVVMDEAGTVLGYTIRDSEDLPPARILSTNLADGARQFRQVLSHRGVTGHSMAFRRRVLEVATPLPRSWVHDQWIFLVGAAMGPVLYVPTVISRYRQHSTQAVGGSLKTSRAWLSDASAVGRDQSWQELARWQDLLTRLERSRSALRSAETTIADATSKVQFIGFRTRVRHQPLFVRLFRVLGCLLTGRYHRLARGFTACARDLIGGTRT